MSKFSEFFRDESGASAAEYALILAIIGLGIFASVQFLGTAIVNAVGSAGNCLQSPSSTTC